MPGVILVPAPNSIPCIPVTWFTPYSVQMVNTLFGGNGLGPSSTWCSLMIQQSRMTDHEADAAHLVPVGRCLRVDPLRPRESLQDVFETTINVA
jgi:hypothetical protein